MGKGLVIRLLIIVGINHYTVLVLLEFLPAQRSHHLKDREDRRGKRGKTREAMGIDQPRRREAKKPEEEKKKGRERGGEEAEPPTGLGRAVMGGMALSLRFSS